MPEMISRVAHTYDGRQLRFGERFDADPRLVGLLTALGRAQVVEEENKTNEYKTRDMSAQSRSQAKPRGRK